MRGTIIGPPVLLSSLSLSTLVEILPGTLSYTPVTNLYAARLTNKTTVVMAILRPPPYLADPQHKLTVRLRAPDDRSKGMIRYWTAEKHEKKNHVSTFLQILQIRNDHRVGLTTRK